jgi:hypothetical protein
MRRLLGLALVYWMVACTKTQGPLPQSPPPPPVPDALPPRPPTLEKLLKAEALDDQMRDFVAGRKVPRGFTSVMRDPGLLLGSVYVIKAKKGKTCDSSDPVDFEEDRLPDYRKSEQDGCKIVPFPSLTRFDQRVSGKVKGELSAVLGSARVNAESVYELKVEDFQTAAFASPRACIDKDALMGRKLPDRTCLAFYITGAVLTQVSWRSYEKADVAANASYLALIKVGTELMGSKETVNVTPVISVDTVDPGTWAVGNDGFLQTDPNKSVAGRQRLGKLVDALEKKQKVDTSDADERWRRIFGPTAR